jgi:hypothetical protein
MNKHFPPLTVHDQGMRDGTRYLILGADFHQSTICEDLVSGLSVHTAHKLSSAKRRNNRKQIEKSIYVCPWWERREITSASREPDRRITDGS